MYTYQPEAVLHHVVIPLCTVPHGRLGLPLLRRCGFQLGNTLAQRREVLEELSFRLFGRCHGSPPITIGLATLCRLPAHADRTTRRKASSIGAATASPPGPLWWVSRTS